MVKKKKKVSKKVSTRKTLPNKPKTDKDIAFDFSVKAYKKFKEVIKSIILFGSVAKNKAKKGSDIDIVIIIDDCVINWDQELIAWYRQELGELLSEQGYNKKIHLTTITLTSFMEEVRAGEPTIINILRYGETLIDHGGFFNPLKVLLAKGKIKPTPEAIFVSLRRAPVHLAKAKIDVVASIENIYWSMVDASHAGLMAAGQVPPSPEYVSELLDEIFVRRNILNKKYLDWFDELYTLAHDIMHGNVKFLSGNIIDKHINRATEFEKVMRGITSKLIKNEKIINIERKES